MSWGLFAPPRTQHDPCAVNGQMEYYSPPLRVECSSLSRFLRVPFKVSQSSGACSIRHTPSIPPQTPDLMADHSTNHNNNNNKAIIMKSTRKAKTASSLSASHSPSTLEKKKKTSAASSEIEAIFARDSSGQRRRRSIPTQPSAAAAPTATVVVDRRMPSKRRPPPVDTSTSSVRAPAVKSRNTTATTTKAGGPGLNSADGSTRRRTEDGLPIYTTEELGIDPDSGSESLSRFCPVVACAPTQSH